MGGRSSDELDDLPELVDEDDLSAMIQRARSQPADRRTLSLVMIGIDHPLQPDDAHDRRSDDHVLRHVAEIIRRRSSEVDVVARHEDDELVVILPGLGERSAERHAEMLRLEIEHCWLDGQRVTASLGMAHLELDSTNARDLLDTARAHMRRAGRLGGNRVVTWDEEKCILPHELKRTTTVVPCLVVLHGPQLGRRYYIEGRTMTIGRATASDIHLDDESVSRTHAIITAADDGPSIRDNSSKNGTFVNGVTIHERRLEYGDAIHIGRTVLALAAFDSEMTNVDALSQISRPRSPARLIDIDRTVSPDAATETVELGASTAPRDADPIEPARSRRMCRLPTSRGS